MPSMKANPFIFGKSIAQLIGLGHGVLPPSRIFAAKDKLNPRSEIKMAGMRQDVGAETFWKNRSHTRSGLVRFFQTVYAQQIDADRPV